MKSHASINRIYRLVFNAALGIWVAVAENAKGRGKGGRPASALIAVLAIISPAAYAANAADASVVVGAGSVVTSGLTTTINQTSQRLAIDWTQLSTAANEALKFNQPNAQAIGLNRITGSNPSSFLGSLTANGQVFILNPNGVLFGAGSEVNVGGLVASTLAMSNADFQAGRSVFTNSGGTGSVVNQGTMTAAQGGYLALLAPEVRNEGVMTASLGTALLAAGNKVTLNLDNGSLLGYSIDQGAINALAENKQLIKADGGQILLSAKAMDALTTATVNNTGIIEARTIQNKAGRVMLMGDMEYGTVNVGGTLDASAPNGGNGGFIETSAAHVKVATGTRVTTKASNGQAGKWLIDPNDFTIAATGGDMDAATVVDNLATTNFEIQTATMGTAGGNGDIHVNEALTWSSANTLTLTAERNININQRITAINGGLVLNAGSGISAQATVNVGTFTLAGGTWRQVGSNLPAFSATDFRISGGTFIRALGGDGLTEAYQLTDAYGLQGAGSAGMLSKHYQLANSIDASGTTDWNSGAGFKPIGNNSTRFTGTFNGDNKTISLLTINRPTENHVGLFGFVAGSSIVTNVGLIGVGVNGSSYVGGLIGYLGSGSISNSYVTGSVTGENVIGGLAGSNGGSISNSYATATVTGSNAFAGVGGLVGSQGFYGSVSSSYSSGVVSATSGLVGGLIGELVAPNGVSNSFWNTDTSGRATSAGGTGKTTTQMKLASTFSAWSIATTGGSNNTWRIYEGNTGPLLRRFMTGLTLADTTVTYNGGTQVGATTGDARVLGGSNASARNAGSYTTGYYSDQQGVDIIGGGLTIDKANLVLATSDVTKTYDGGLSALGAAVVAGGTVLQTGDTMSGGSFAFTNKNAGIGNKAVTASGVTVNDGNSGNNYNVSYVDNTSSTINQAVLTVTANAVTKTYDGGLSATGTGTVGALAGAAAGELVHAAGTQAFLDKNFGLGNKTVRANGVTIKDAGNTDVTGNYAITYTDNTASTITQKALTVSGITAANKTYDQNDSARVSTAGAAYSGLIAGDALTVSATGVFTDKNATLGKTVNLTSSYTGADVGNYTITDQATTTANIDKLAIVGTINGQDKVYDGNTTATIGFRNLTGVISGDAVSYTGGTASFGDKNAGIAKAITATGLSLTGTDAGNYTVNSAAASTGDIDRATLTVTAAAQNKVYDATTVATLAFTDTRIAGDTLSFTSSASFSDKNVGTAKTVNYSGLAQTGPDAGNYTLVSATSGTSNANITPAALLVTANNDSRQAGSAYSGGNGVAYTGLVAGETSTVLGGALTYGGSAQGASTAGSYAITLGGYSATNYTISYVNGVLSLAPAQTITAGGTVEAALGGPTLVVAYGGALQTVGAITGGGGSGVGGGGGGAGASGGDAGALAAAAEAGNGDEE
jgi:filamentous hemagglutinin family protein